MRLTRRQRIYIVLYLLAKNGPTLQRDINSEIEKLGFGSTTTSLYQYAHERRDFIMKGGYGPRWEITDTGREHLHRLLMRTFPLVMRVLRDTDLE